jgi:hypothetical protein
MNSKPQIEMAAEMNFIFKAFDTRPIANSRPLRSPLPLGQGMEVRDVGVDVGAGSGARRARFARAEAGVDVGFWVRRGLELMLS